MSKDSKATKKAMSADSKLLKKGTVSSDSKPAEKSAASDDSKPTEKTSRRATANLLTRVPRLTRAN